MKIKSVNLKWWWLFQNCNTIVYWLNYYFHLFAGGGITERNLERILSETGAREFHASARSALTSSMTFRKEGVPMGAALTPPEFSVKVTDSKKVEKFTEIAKGVWFWSGAGNKNK